MFLSPSIRLRSNMQLIAPATLGRKAFCSFSTDSLNISSAFYDIGLVPSRLPAPERKVQVLEILKNQTVCEVYKSLCCPFEEISFTPEQAGEFFVQNKSILLSFKHAAFFLLNTKMGIRSGIFVPYPSGYAEARLYHMDTPYTLNTEDGYLFLALE